MDWKSSKGGNVNEHFVNHLILIFILNMLKCIICAPLQRQGVGL